LWADPRLLCFDKLMTCKSREGIIELEIEFLTGTDVENAIEGLVAEYDELHWAVAWGTSTSLARKRAIRESG